MRIIIVGPGALGCLLAAVVQKGCTAADSVMLLDHDHTRAELLNRRGVLLEYDGDTRSHAVPAGFDPAGAAPADVVFVCVKSYDIDATFDFCAPLLINHPLLLFFQNGIAHLRYRRFAAGPAIFATTTEGSTSLAPGHVRHGGTGTTSLGFLDPPQQDVQQMLEKIIATLRRGGLNARHSEAMLSRIWTKLIINAGINALTAIHDCPNGELLHRPHVHHQMRLAVEEAATLASHLHIEITDAVETTQAVCQSTAANISSMLQDVRRRRKTEIDAINGALVKLAAENGLTLPVNSYLVQRIKEIEGRYALSENTA